MSDSKIPDFSWLDAQKKNPKKHQNAFTSTKDEKTSASQEKKPFSFPSILNSNQNTASSSFSSIFSTNAVKDAKLSNTISKTAQDKATKFDWILGQSGYKTIQNEAKKEEKRIADMLAQGKAESEAKNGKIDEESSIEGDIRRLEFKKTADFLIILRKLKKTQNEEDEDSSDEEEEEPERVEETNDFELLFIDNNSSKKHNFLLSSQIDNNLLPNDAFSLKIGNNNTNNKQNTNSIIWKIPQNLLNNAESPIIEIFSDGTMKIKNFFQISSKKWYFSSDMFIEFENCTFDTISVRCHEIHIFNHVEINNLRLYFRTLGLLTIASDSCLRTQNTHCFNGYFLVCRIIFFCAKFFLFFLISF